MVISWWWSLPFYARQPCLTAEATQWHSHNLPIMYVPSLNFKTCHFIYWGGSHVAVWYFTIVFTLFYVTVAVSTHLGVTCHHICCPMSLFQGHVTCRNFTPPPLPQDKAPVNSQLVCLQPVGICNDNTLHVFINALSHFVIKCLCL